MGMGDIDRDVGNGNEELE